MIIPQFVFGQTGNQENFGTLEIKGVQEYFVQIDSVIVGKDSSYVFIKQLPVGKYKISIYRECQKTVQSSFEIKANLKTEFAFLDAKKSDDLEKCANISREFYFNKYGVNYLIKTEGNTDVFLDGNKVNSSSFELTGGEHIFRLQNGKKQKVVRAIIDKEFLTKLTYRELYVLPARSKYIRYSAIPGVAQVYGGRKVAGGIQLVAFAAATVLALNSNSEIKKMNDQYDRAIREINTNLLSENLEELEQNARAIFSDIETERDLRDMLLASAGAIYLYSLIDAYLLKRPVFGDRTNSRFGIDISPQPNNLTLNVRVKL